MCYYIRRNQIGLISWLENGVSMQTTFIFTRCHLRILAASGFILPMGYFSLFSSLTSCLYLFCDKLLPKDEISCRSLYPTKCLRSPSNRTTNGDTESFPLISKHNDGQPICANLMPLEGVRAIGLFCGVVIVSSYMQQPLCQVAGSDIMGSSSVRQQPGTGSSTVWQTTVHVACRNRAALHKQSDRRHFSFTATHFAALCCAYPRASHFIDACNFIHPLVKNLKFLLFQLTRLRLIWICQTHTHTHKRKPPLTCYLLGWVPVTSGIAGKKGQLHVELKCARSGSWSKYL